MSAAAGRELEAALARLLAKGGTGRPVAPEEAPETALTTLAGLVLDAARIGEPRLPDHFAELTGALLPLVPAGVRAELSVRLAHLGHLPEAVVRLFTDDEIRVAGPMLRQSPVIGPAELLAIAEYGPTEAARAIAGRADLRDDAITALIDRDDPVVASAIVFAPLPVLAAALASRIALVPGLPRVAAMRLAERRDLSDAALAELFWTLDTGTRRQIVDRFVRRHQESAGAERPGGGAGPASGAAGPDEILGQPLFAQAAAGRREAVPAMLAEALGLSRETAARIGADTGGEAAVIAMRAAGLPPERITGIVLLSSPEAGRSYDTLRTLVGLAEDIAAPVAARIVMLWDGRAGGPQPGARRAPAVARPSGRSRTGIVAGQAAGARRESGPGRRTGS